MNRNTALSLMGAAAGVGVLAAAGYRMRARDVSDSTLVERVRSRLRSAVSHPDVIVVYCNHGVVKLIGPVLRDEAERAIRAAHRVSGVRDVVDYLERHDASENVRALRSMPT